MDEIEVNAFKSARAKKLTSGGFVYRKDRDNEKTLKTTWRCSRRGCPGRAYTVWRNSKQLNQGMVATLTQAHTHALDTSLPDSVEWIECSEVRRSASISEFHVEFTELSVPASDLRQNESSPSFIVPSPTETDKKPTIDLKFDVDFDASRQPSTSLLHNQVDGDLYPPRKTSPKQPKDVEVGHSPSARKLTSGGYSFRKDRDNEKTLRTTWRCSRRGCTGRAYTVWCSSTQRLVAQHTQAHCHAPDTSLPDSQWLQCSEGLKWAIISLSSRQEAEQPGTIDMSTQFCDSGQEGQACLSDTAPPAAGTKRKHSESMADLEFKVDLNVHFDAEGESSTSSSHHQEIQEDLSLEQKPSKAALMMGEGEVPQSAKDAVLVRSQGMPEGSQVVRGYDFNNGVDYRKLFQSYATSGFQATSVGRAMEEINKMITCKLQPIAAESRTEINLNMCGRQNSNCTIFLAYTSNLISSGTRETLRYLAQHNMVDVIVTTAGGIEEDFIKCLAPTYLGDFALQGRELRSKGINRIGNLLVPNNNYCMFEDWLTPILDALLHEQREQVASYPYQEQGVMWTPSKVIHRLGQEINHPDSVYFWAYKNNIPVFCPALTDGSLGDIIFFHSYKNPGLVIDIVEDLRRMNNQAMCAVNTGMIILGGGLCKHHTCNANLMRNGADYSVFVNTASEFDGSDSGARPDEAISWGKIKTTANPVKVYGEASVIFPILVAETFARRQEEFKTSKDSKANIVIVTTVLETDTCMGPTFQTGAGF